MDFLGIIQWVMDVQQYPESHKEEIERLKGECSNLSNLIKMIGEDELPEDLRGQIKRNLEEAEELLRKVPRKAGMLQSFISMLPGQQVLQKLKDASDNIHRTVNNVNTWMNCRIFSKKLQESDNNGQTELGNSLRISKVKKSSSIANEKEDNYPYSSLNSHQSGSMKSEPMGSIGEVGPTFVEGLQKTLVEEGGDEDEDDLFGNQSKQMKVSFTLDKNGTIYDSFELYTINIREQVVFDLNEKDAFTFQRTTYHPLSEKFKDVNRISREHASLHTVKVRMIPGNKEEESQTIVKGKTDKHEDNKEKDEENFATCEQVFTNDDDDEKEAFGDEKKEEFQFFCYIECLGANGISVYRKRENEGKQNEIIQSIEEFAQDLKFKVIKPGQWVDVAKGEKAFLFNNDSFALLRKEKITISYTIKIE